MAVENSSGAMAACIPDSSTKESFKVLAKWNYLHMEFTRANGKMANRMDMVASSQLLLKLCHKFIRLLYKIHIFVSTKK